MKTTASLIFVAGLLPAFGAAHAQDADQIAWLVKGTPDPAAIQAHDGTGNYIFATGEGIAIWHSKGQKKWKRIGRVFEEAVPGWARKLIPKADSIWAPDVQFHDGRYYLYYSVSTFGSQRSVIGLAMNTTLDPTSPRYKWEDQGLVLESFPEKNDYNAIDPAMFVDGGRGYLVWGSYWTGIKGAELDLKTGKPISSQPKPVSIAARAATGPTSIEGAYIQKHGEFYYLYVSWDFCCAREKSTYKVMVGRAKSPLGPYVDDAGRKMTDGGGKLVLMSDSRWRGPGHNSVLKTKDQDWLVYHVVDGEAPNRGRILQLRPIEWIDGWPTVGDPVGVESPATKQSIAGRWDHVVNNRDRYDIFLEPTGEITGTKRQG
ncbi:MAG: arabinan endo-1,5-alpha-L-arabinosidase [Planctomycetes bacterium]|nr:arabinan endo-1,5-alpha-L-arabinosidase [Planctomycetota bacterium]